VVYDHAAQAEFRRLSYRKALRKLAAAEHRNFGDPKEGEKRLSDLLAAEEKERWVMSKSIEDHLKWLASGTDALAERANMVLDKQHRLQTRH
jgi:hypothetical protein